MDLHQLKALSTLKYQQSEQQISVLRTREDALRAELSRLRSLVIETQAQPQEQAEIRSIGADVIWLKWIGRAQRQLNIELAQVLAQKEAHMAQHKRAHGKMMVADQLADAADEEQKKNQRARQLSTAIDQTLLR